MAIELTFEKLYLGAFRLNPEHVKILKGRLYGCFIWEIHEHAEF